MGNGTWGKFSTQEYCEQLEKAKMLRAAVAVVSSTLRFSHHFEKRRCWRKSFDNDLLRLSTESRANK